MASPSTFLSSLLILLLLLLLACRSNGVPLYQSCSSTSNYTANSTYETNLKLLLPSLTSKGSATGFFNDTRGDTPNRVYGLVLCRGDVNAGSCRSCLTTAATDAMLLCPYNKGTIVFYDLCHLRYSDQLFFSTNDNSPTFYTSSNQSVTEAPDLFQNRVEGMMNTLVNYSVINSTRLFATGQVNFSEGSPSIYGLTQCTRDLSADQCKKCFQGFVNSRPAFLLGKQGAIIIGASCNYRYELYSFYNGTALVSIPTTRIATNTTGTNSTIPSGSNPTSQGNNNNSTDMVLTSVIPVAAVLYIYYCRKKKSAKRIHYGTGSQEITTIESLLFDLSTLKVATDYFSDSNKLGEGGFGVVYKGTLSDGQEIAVKRLSTYSAQGLEELKNEVVLLAKLQHRNLVRLSGVCLEEEEKLLVYEYVVNRSLDTFLFEYAMRGHFSNKSDVFSFGVLVLEIVTGRKNSSFSNSDQSADLPSYVWEHWSNGMILEIIDQSLGEDYPRSEVLQCIQIGLLCVQEAAADRPTMSSVVLMLNSHSTSLQVPLQPAFLPGYTPSQSTTKTEPLLSRNDLSITELEPR